MKKIKKIIYIVMLIGILFFLWSCTTKYNVTYLLDSNGEVYEIESVLKSAKATPPTEPEKEGYEFIGWYLNDEKYDFTKEVTETLILIAKWEEVTVEEKIKVSFVVDDNVTTIEVDRGTLTEKPIEPEKEGYEFIGWYLNDEKYDFTQEVTETLILIAKWEEVTVEEKIKVSFVVDDNVTTIEVDRGTLTEKPIEPKKEGYEFIGWYLNDEKYDFTKEVTETLILIAKWEEVTVEEKIKVSFVVDDNVTTIEVDRGTLIEKPIEPEKEGYEFIGWYLNDEKYDFGTIINEEITLFARWSLIEISETLFKIFYLNDTHGAVLNNGSEIGLAKLGNYIKKESDQSSIFIAGGDMLQGQLISNASKGAIMIEIFNNLNLDAFVIGNHEFDWGLDVILKYFDPNTTNIKANFPLLGANVIEKSTNKRPEFIDSHVIIKRDNYKIGIVGVIGDGLESSIATLRVKDYYFSDAYTAVKKTVEEIKDEVDFILVVNHHDNKTFNNKVSQLDKVSAIFNGHTHKKYTGYINATPYIQSGSNGEMIGQIELEFSKKDGLTNSNVQNINVHNNLNNADEEVSFIIEAYYEEIAYLYEEEIIKASKFLSKEDLAFFIAKLMAKSTGAVFAFQNSGGTRAAIAAGPITASDVFKVFPFDNMIVSVEILGSDLKTLAEREKYKYLDINIDEVKNNNYYLIATNDYVFYNSYNKNIFASVYDEVKVHKDLYETFYDYLVKLNAAGYQYFNTNSPFDFELVNNYVIFYEGQKRKYLSL